MRRALCLAIVLLPSLARADEPDYALDSRAWNGLTELVAEARAQSCEVLAPDALDWSAVGPHDALWFLYPRASVDGKRLRRFLAAGGRALLADDFGDGGETLASLEVRRSTAPLPAEVPRYRHNPALPIAHPVLASELGRATGEIVGNHAAHFESALPATYAFSDGAALVVEGQVGAGYFVALADPSVLINNMLELDGNRAFARALVRRTCRPGEDRILVFAGRFATRGEPPPGEAGSPFSRFNQMLGALNATVRDAAGDPRVLAATALAFALATLIVLGGALPARSALDESWERVARLFRRDALTPFATGLPWDYALPASLLRDEAAARLREALGVDATALPPRELGRRVRAQHGDEAGRVATELWQKLGRLGWRAGEPPSPVSRRRLLRLHALATALFDQLATPPSMLR